MSVLFSGKVYPIVSEGTPQTEQIRQPQVLKDTQKNKIIIPRKTYDTSANRIFREIEQRDRNLEIQSAIKFKKPEPSVPDSLLNIYTGNPGLFSTDGDTIAFGNVEYLPDSVFLEQSKTSTGRSIKPYGLEGKFLPHSREDWLLGVILVAWFLFASVKVGFNKYLNLLMGSLIKIGDANRLYMERGYKKLYGAMRLNIIFYIIVPLAVFQILDFFDVKLSGVSSLFFFLIIFIGINSFFLFKNIVYKAIGTVIMLEQEIDESTFNMFLFYKGLGLFLLPLVTVHAIDHRVTLMTVWMMIFLIVMFYFVSILRSIYIGNQKGISIFYLILYLCLLEIMPLILVYKLLIVA